MTDFKPGDRVKWLGFVTPNYGEPERPIGTLGTVTRADSIGVIEVNWDGGSGAYQSGRPYSGSTWTENIALVDETPAPADPDLQALRERLLDKAIKAIDFGSDADTIVETAKAFEAYVTGDTK